MENEAFPLPGRYYHKGLLLFEAVPQEHLKTLKDYQLQDGDIFVSGYPKTGTTWMTGTVSAILQSDNLEKFERGGPPHPRIPIEMPGIAGYNKISTQPRPGVFQTHLWPDMLPDDVFNKNIKVIHTIRNPKDVAVSYYSFTKMNGLLGQVDSNWTNYLKAFMNGNVGYGNYFEHLKHWLRVKDHPNVMLVIYEEYIKNPCETISKLGTFIGKNLDQEKVEELARILSFTTMKSNPKLDIVFEHYNNKGSFMRKGCIGDWKNHFTEEQNEIFEDVCNKFTQQNNLSFTFV